MFNVYNSFDSMDCVHVSSSTEVGAIEAAIKDGYLTEVLGVSESNIVAYPFSEKCQTSDFIRRLNSDGVVTGGLK